MSSNKSSPSQKPKRAKSKNDLRFFHIFPKSLLTVSVMIIFTFVAALVAIWAIDNARYEGKVARNVSVTGFDVGGMSPSELSTVLDSISSNY